MRAAFVETGMAFDPPRSADTIPTAYTGERPIQLQVLSPNRDVAHGKAIPRFEWARSRGPRSKATRASLAPQRRHRIDARGSRAERDAHADLLSAPRDLKRDAAVDARERKQERRDAEHAEQHEVEPARRELRGMRLLGGAKLRHDVRPHALHDVPGGGHDARGGGRPHDDLEHCEAARALPIWPVERRPRLLIEAEIADVGDHAYDPGRAEIAAQVELNE